MIRVPANANRTKTTTTTKNMKISLTSSIALLMSSFLAAPTAIQGQAMLCFGEDCSIDSELTCQEFINSKTDWAGSGCSFQDVADETTTTTECRLTVTGGGCSWRSPEMECASDATECVYAGEVLSDAAQETNVCPTSAYDPFIPVVADQISASVDSDESEEEPSVSATSQDLSADSYSSSSFEGRFLRRRL